MPLRALSESTDVTRIRPFAAPQDVLILFLQIFRSSLDSSAPPQAALTPPLNLKSGYDSDPGHVEV
jgi:hypothetical protein